jgi:3',5'-nucleoside bisphosphate phosphatase
MKVDLHCHSLASDGALTPQHVVERASANKVEMLALTDHDTIAGLSEASVAAADLGLQFVAGIELSSQWSGVGIHVVGLNIDPQNPDLILALAGQSKKREERAQLIGKKLGKLGFDNCYEGAKNIAGDSELGRPHFARYMVEQGYVEDHSSAFNKYLGAGKVGDVKNQWPEIEEVVSWIHTAGGYAVLAHPDKYKLTRTKLRRLLTYFKQVRGDAMEVVSGSQNKGVTDHLSRLCEEFDLYASCGSDFHNPNTQWCDLGKVAPLPKICRPVWSLWSSLADQETLTQ